MSLAIRIIPRLDIKGPNLVKGMHLEGLRVLGKPEEFARYYYEQGADELIFQDVVASLYGRNSLHEIIERTAKQIFIPLTVGGGLRTLDDIYKVLRAGADKVAMNTAVINDPQLIKRASKAYGVSTIVVAIEAIRQPEGGYWAFTDNGRNETGLDVIEWAREAEQLGAGEILLTSVDQEGGGKGYECNLIEKVVDSVSIPVVAHGGAGKKEHIADLARLVDISGVAISSILHYEFINNNKNLKGYEDEGNIDFLASNRLLSHIKIETISDIKSELKKHQIICRGI